MFFKVYLIFPDLSLSTNVLLNSHMGLTKHTHTIAGYKFSWTRNCTFCKTSKLSTSLLEKAIKCETNAHKIAKFSMRVRLGGIARLALARKSSLRNTRKLLNMFGYCWNVYRRGGVSEREVRIKSPTSGLSTPNASPSIRPKGNCTNKIKKYELPSPAWAFGEFVSRTNCRHIKSRRQLSLWPFNLRPITTWSRYQHITHSCHTRAMLRTSCRA